MSGNRILIVGCLWSLAVLLGPGCSRTKPAPGNANPPVTQAEPKVMEPLGAGAKQDTANQTKSPGAQEGGTPIEGPTGTIEGTVTYTGEVIPQSDIVTNTTDPLVCGAEISKRDKEISPTNRGIRHVLVWLEDVKLPDGYKPPKQNLVLDNRNCQFEPHAAVTTVGSIIEATNSDAVFHTTNLYGSGLSENMPLVSKGSSQKTIVRRAGTVQVKCDKHGWMQAFVRVDPHPFHAVTDENGEFSIANVPVGTYKLKVLHEVFSTQDLDVSVEDGKASTLEIKYPTD